ncbi:MAG: methionyl-tRNA formyltransferase [Clostridiaceae bacterium]
MALIKISKLKKLDKIRNSVHKEVIGTYTVFTHRDTKYFQIDTYGSEDREMPEKISQSIQFDFETAKFIIEILKKEMNIE